MAEPFTPSVAPVTDFAEWVLEDASATEILTSKTVVLSQALNLKVLMPYFVENRCLTLAEMRNFKCERAFDQEENMQFIEIVSKRGSAAFQGLIKAIDQYTAKEPGEGALIELSNKLRADMKKVGAPRPGPSAPEPASGGDAGVTDSDKAKLAVDDGGEDGQKKRKSRRSHIPGVPKFFILFLRFAGIASFVLSVPLVIAGTAILYFSFGEFAGTYKCNNVGIKHALSVFNFFFGLLCFGGPALLILFCLYFCLEDPKTKWTKKYRITRCVVWVQTIVFLTVFILIVLELLYSLLYVIPELINNYNDWDQTNTVTNETANETNCAAEVYLTSFSIVTVSYSVVFLLLVVLGVFLANHYFQWVSDEKHPGVVMKVIYVCLGRDDNNDNDAHIL